MTPQEFTDLQEALIYVFTPILLVIISLVFSGGLLSALVALGMEIATHRRRKTPSF